MQSFIPDAVSMDQLTSAIEAPQPPELDLSFERQMEVGELMLDQLPDGWTTNIHVAAMTAYSLQMLWKHWQQIADDRATAGDTHGALHAAAKAGQLGTIYQIMLDAYNISEPTG